MPNFSDYVIYVDESGDHSLDKIHSNYPIFVLAFCIFRKASYINEIVPAFQQLKFKWFGHDAVVFHEREIRQQTPPFKFLQNKRIRNEFLGDLTSQMVAAEMTIVSAVIKKDIYKAKYHQTKNPYEIAMQFCIERTVRFLRESSSGGKLSHCIFECRGEKEDKDLELEFRRVLDGQNYRSELINELDVKFVPKAANCSGLQIADLVARPIGLSVLKPEQRNRSFDIIKTKFRKSPTGNINGWGLKVFP